MESEFYALASSAEEVEYLRELLLDFPLSKDRMLGIAISCDKAAAPATKNDLYNGKKRTMSIHNTHVSSLLKRNVISVIDVRSQENLADPFTKGLTRELVEKTSVGMGLKCIM